MSTFILPVRIYYEDTDAGGVVYHSNYLRFMERARTEWLRAAGYEQDELLHAYGILFAVRKASLDFARPARFNDLVHVSAEVMRKGKASVDFRQEVRRGHELLCTGDVRLVCLDGPRFVPVAIPDEVARHFVPPDGGPGES